jgi:hypothetical protein
VNDYLSTNSNFPEGYEFPRLGIDVKNGEGMVQNCGQFDGVEIVAVNPGGPEPRLV